MCLCAPAISHRQTRRECGQASKSGEETEFGHQGSTRTKELPRNRMSGDPQIGGLPAVELRTLSSSMEFGEDFARRQAIVEEHSGQIET
jgi:hypothetical protein